MRTLALEEVKSWLRMESMPVIGRSFRLINATLGASDNEPEARREVFDQIVTTRCNEPILWHTENEKNYTIKQAFQAAILEKEAIFDDLELDAPPLPVELHVLSTLKKPVGSS